MKNGFEIKKIKNEGDWQKIRKDLSVVSFLQSFGWAEFQRSLGKRVYHFSVFQGGKINLSCLLIKEKFPRGGKSFFYIPLGPSFAKGLTEQNKKEVFSFLLGYLFSLAKKEKAVFLRIEPIENLPYSFGKKAIKRIQPQKSWVLDLDKSEEDIFKGFTYRVRYNIRLSERKGVKVEFLENYHPDFYKLLKKIAEADRFGYFPENHYINLFNHRDKDFRAIMCLAKYENKVIAANILIFFEKTVISLHGASDHQYRQLKAPSLIHWEVIKKAKKEGASLYDFWGFDEEKWPGFSYFKKTFGGRMVKYPEGREQPFSKLWYFLYSLYKKL